MIIFNINAILEINNTIASGENLKSRNYENQIKTKKQRKIDKLYKLLTLINKISIQNDQQFEIIFLFGFLLCILACLHQMHLFLLFLERREI